TAGSGGTNRRTYRGCRGGKWCSVSSALASPGWRCRRHRSRRSGNCRRSRPSEGDGRAARRSLSWISGRISQRIVVAVIGSLPRTLEVFCRHAGPSASVVNALATLREDYFDAVGPERRLTPFGPIRIRTVICKGDGFFDGIRFNGPGQFSYFV